MTPFCEDWRGLPAAAVDPLIDTEAQHWNEELNWDVREAWSVMGPARTAGNLPGLTLRDASGRLTGWTCFLNHRQTLQVATLVADSPEATARLLDGIVASPEAVAARTHVVCVREAAPHLREALAARGFDVAIYHYLTAAAGGALTPVGVGRLWQPSDRAAVASLCADAYAGARDVRAFAPHGDVEEWHEYIASLVLGSGCGRFVPEASFVVPGRDAGRLDGAIVTTDLGLGTAHIAQVAVGPDARGRGLGRRLVEAAREAAAARGLDRITLLVADGNTRARALYDRLGFVGQATFVVGVNRQPRRLSSVALATGGASTRR